MNGTVTPDSLDGQTDNKGYTGHEMLDDLDLVHMNGRVYEPLIGRFLSADPYVQDFYNGQSCNRYTYVLNNPTNLTDPTGYEWSEYMLVYGSVMDSKAAAGEGRVGMAIFHGVLAITDGATLGVGTLIKDGVKVLIKAEIKREAAEQLSKHGAEQAARATEKATAEQAAIQSEKAAGEGGASNRHKARLQPPSVPRILEVGSGAVGEGEAKKGGRNANKVSPVTEAEGPHSVMKRDAAGNTTNTATYNPNPKNPTGHDEVKRVDITGRAHTNANRTKVDTPHVHEAGVKDVRPALPEELPKR
ncbi:hypothetical protein KDM87_11465 [Undibacterium sp. FT147W]|uniref:RHS repeat-associated core domain-containing protein n=1 Tax=Undibacterium rivi TaxID=2828729 RepID=A0ABS5H556_9BURK|nr:hypothetical protein [Undibacterium rivi]